MKPFQKDTPFDLPLGLFDDFAAGPGVLSEGSERESEAGHLLVPIRFGSLFLVVSYKERPSLLRNLERLVSEMAVVSARGFDVLFTDVELKEIAGLKKGEGFVEVTCGCTSPRYGDAVGRLRVFASGKLEITCECYPGCSEDKLTPAAFEKHSGRESQRRWKYYVWVIVKGKKVPLLKTTLLKYHEKIYGRRSHKGNKGRPFHRDEFVRCNRCNKERRFHLQTQLECRTYHDAVLDPNWKCSDFPSDEYTCDDEEERASRRSLRGCSRSPLCKGCTLCVCFGCEVCRFPDCSCQTCIDFVNNAAN